MTSTPAPTGNRRDEEQGAPWGGALARPLPSLDDEEGERVPDALPPVIDAHVHVFPDKLAEAIRRWFDEHGWPVRYRFTAEQLTRFLLARGVEHLVLLPYAHRPGMAGELNRFVASLCADDGRLTGLATVMPGEPGLGDLLREAFSLGLAGVKLHQHVQCFDPAGPEVRAVCAVCADHGKPLVAHFGREPRSPALKCNPHEWCSAHKTRELLREFPAMKLCVPHLGSDEFEGYARLLEEFDNLWLDTTMMLSDYFPGPPTPALTRFRADRVMYGTDFCNLPYAWDRELVSIGKMGLEAGRLERLLAGNARDFFGLG